MLLEGDHGLGAALAWADRAGASSVDILVDDDAAAIAHQGAQVRTPVTVWSIDGRALAQVDPEEPPVPAPPPDAPELVAVLQDRGLDVVVEGDRLSAEFRGLEVARIVRALDDGEPLLEIGVGKYDRALTAMVHGDQSDPASLDRVVALLRDLRRPGGPNHPLFQLVPERWLRSVLVADPESIGCRDLVPVPTPTPRDRLRPRGIAAATGHRGDDRVVVVCSVGVDLQAPVSALWTRAVVDPDATLLLVTPEADAVPAVRRLVADAVAPAEIVTVPADWRR